MSAMENQINRAEKMVTSKGEPSGPKRLWFQSHKERMEEKERFRLAAAGVDGTTAKKAKSKKDKSEGQKPNKKDKAKEMKKARKKKEATADERAQGELKKAMLMQVRLAKKMNKPKSMRQSNDVEEGRPSKASKKAPSKSGSSFAHDLTNTSRTTVKKLRYEGKQPHKAAKGAKSNGRKTRKK